MSEQDLLALFDIRGWTPEDAAYLAEQQAIAAQSLAQPWEYPTYQNQISPPSFEGAAGLAATRPQAVINPQWDVPVSPAPDYDPYAQYTSGANDVAMQAAEAARLQQMASRPPEEQFYAGQPANWSEEPMGPPSGGAFATSSTVGGGGTYYSDSGGYGGLAPRGSAAVAGGLLGLTPDMRQAGIERENQPGIIGQFLENLSNHPLLSYPLGAAGMQGPQTGSITTGEALGGAYDAYMTDLPFGVSDFMRDTVRPFAGDVGAEVFDAATPKPLDALGRLLGLGDVSRDVGRFAGEAVVPITAGDFALELIPGIGTIPDLARVAPDIARQAVRGLDNAALRALGDAPVTVWHIPSSDEGLESILRTGLNPGTAVTTDRELAEAISARWGFEPLEFQTTASRLVPDAYYQRTTTPLRVGEPAGGGLRQLVGAETGAIRGRSVVTQVLDRYRTNPDDPSLERALEYALTDAKSDATYKRVKNALADVVARREAKEAARKAADDAEQASFEALSPEDKLARYNDMIAQNEAAIASERIGDAEINMRRQANEVFAERRDYILAENPHLATGTPFEAVQTPSPAAAGPPSEPPIPPSSAAQGGDYASLDIPESQRAQWKAWRPDKPASRTLNEAEERAVQRYIQTLGTTVNNYLRTGRLSSNDSVQQIDEIVSGLDSAFAKASLPQPLTVYRGVPNLPETWPTTPDKAYVSTTASREIAENFAHHGTVVEIDLPAGYPAIKGATQEQEILLPRGAQFEVVSREPYALKLRASSSSAAQGSRVQQVIAPYADDPMSVIDVLRRVVQHPDAVEADMVEALRIAGELPEDYLYEATRVARDVAGMPRASDELKARALALVDEWEAPKFPGGEDAAKEVNDRLGSVIEAQQARDPRNAPVPPPRRGKRASSSPSSAAQGETQPIKAWRGVSQPSRYDFDPDAYKLGARADSSALGVHFTTDTRLGRQAAATYAGSKGTVHEVELNARLYPMSRDEYNRLGSLRQFREFRDRLAAQGYDGVRYPEGASQAGEVAVWNTDTIVQPSPSSAAPPVEPPRPPAAGGTGGSFSEGDAVLALRNALREPQGERARIVAQGRKRQAARIAAAVEGTTETGQAAARQAGQAGAGKILPEDGLGFKLPKEADDALVEKALNLYREGKMSVFDAVYGVPRALDEGRRLGPTETQARLLSQLTAIDEASFAPFVRTRTAMDQGWRQAINDEVAKVGLDEAAAVRTQLQAGKRSELTAAHLDARGQAEQAASARLRAQTHYAKADAIRAENIRKASEKAITDEIKAIGRVSRRAQVQQRRAMRTIGGLENRAMKEESERLARFARQSAAAQESWNNAMARSPSQALKDEADLAARMTAAFPTVDRSPQQILQDAAERITDEVFKGALETRTGMEALEALRYHITGNRAILSRLHNAEGVRHWVGAARAGITGELADSYLTSLIHRNHTLGQALTDLGTEPKVVTKITNEVLNAELRQRFPEGIPERVIKELDTMKGAPYEESLAGLQLLSQRFKNSMFGLLDMGIFGVQTLAAIRRGGVPLLAGNINKVLSQLHAPHIDTDIAEVALNKRIRNMLDGVGTLSQSGSSVRAGSGSMLSYLGPWGKAVDQKVYSPIAEGLNEVQFGNVLGWVRDNAYEGNLVMLNMLGRDITNPEVRRVAAETANSISSFAQSALRSSRAGIEGTLLTSPAMTRSQASNILQMSKLLNPKASLDERVMAGGLIASQVGFYLTIGKYLNDQVGITDFEFDPSERGFGLITLNDKDANGNNRVLNLFPQMSIDRAFAQSIRSLAEGNEQDALDSWLRYFSGRAGASPIGGPLLALGGVGYSSGLVGDLGPGRFSKDLPPADRLLKLVPLPPLIMSALNAAQDGFDTISTVFDYFGMSEFPESQYGTEDRFAKNLFDAEYWDLPVSQQVLVHRAMKDAGEDVTDEAVTGPFFGSWRQAYEDLQAQSPELAKYGDADAFRAQIEKELAAELGRTPNRQETDKVFDQVLDKLGMTERVNAYKLIALALDPNIIDAWQRQYNETGEGFPPGKTWIDAAAKFIKYPEEARAVLEQLRAAGYDVPEIPAGITQRPDAKPGARYDPGAQNFEPDEEGPPPTDQDYYRYQAVNSKLVGQALGSAQLGSGDYVNTLGNEVPAPYGPAISMSNALPQTQRSIAATYWENQGFPNIAEVTRSVPARELTSEERKGAAGLAHWDMQSNALSEDFSFRMGNPHVAAHEGLHSFYFSLSDSDRAELERRTAELIAQRWSPAAAREMQENDPIHLINTLIELTQGTLPEDFRNYLRSLQPVRLGPQATRALPLEVAR